MPAIKIKNFLSVIIILISFIILFIPIGIALGETSPLVYVTLGNQYPLIDSVRVIDALTNEVIDSVNATHSPNNIVLSRDGTKGWTTHGFSHVIGSFIDNVNELNLTTKKVSRTITRADGLGKSIGDAELSPDESYLFVPSADNDLVSVINTTNFTVVKNIFVGELPLHIATGITLHGPRAYVANHQSNDVSVIDLQTLEVVKNISVPGGPSHVTLSLDGKRAYVTAFFARNLTIIDTETNNILAVIQGMGEDIIGVAVHPKGTAAYVVGETSRDVTVVNLTSNKVVKKISVSNAAREDPREIALNADGTRAYVSNRVSGTVVVIDTSNPLEPVVVKNITVGGNPLGIAVLPKLVPTDNDNDGILDILDNCPNNINPNQENFDGDSMGDACDPDDDNDAVLDGNDVCQNSVFDDAPAENHYSWLGSLFFKTKNAQTKEIVDSSYTIASLGGTGGCTCAQILDKLTGKPANAGDRTCTKIAIDNFVSLRSLVCLN